jgi:diguanylate cyclase (GGDEF)-like protein/PAS domain S-box-containing protein
VRFIRWLQSRWNIIRRTAKPRNGHGELRRGRAMWPNLAAAAIGLVLSTSVWFAFSVREDRAAEGRFSAQANAQALALQNGIDDYVDYLAALRAFLQSSEGGVSRREFTAFSASVLGNKTAILSLAWLPRISRDQRAAHELAAAQEGLPDYHIQSLAADGRLVPAAEASEYFPLLYISSEAPSSPIYGRDLNDGNIRQRTLERARDGDGMATSQIFLLTSVATDRSGFFIVMPVYAQGLPHDTVEDRRSNLIGFVQATFQISVMIERILANTTNPSGLDLYVFDADSGPDASPLHFHPSRDRPVPIAPRPRAELLAGPHWTGELRGGDARWTIVETSIPGGPGTPHETSWIVLAGCLLVSAIVVAYISAAGRHAQRLQAANKQLDQALGALNGVHQQLMEQNTRFDAALNNMIQGLVMFDSAERIVVCNDRYIEMYGLSRAIVKPGCTLRELIRHWMETGHPKVDPEQYRAEFLAGLAQGKTMRTVIQTADGREISVTNRPMDGSGCLVTHEDITERHRAQAKIAYMAGHDGLTDLPNRLLFNELLGPALSNVKRGGHLAVLCLDIDHFKNVNDTLGHPAGDIVLRKAADRLRECLRDVDAAARLGGDEFAILQIGTDQPADVTALASRLIQAIGAPHDADGHRLVVGVSIGIAIAPEDGTSPEQLLKNADMALYRAKTDGRGVYRFFEPEMDARMQARHALELDLRKAIVQGEFELLYQPLVDIRTEEVNGCEALIRWKHPERGMILPLEFIPLAEETGLIVPIGEWVLRQACMEAAIWPSHVKIAVNLSPVQLKSKSLLTTVTMALAASGLSPSRLELEITETVLLQESDSTLAILHQLRAIGIGISMDDFGTGYSSLSYLRKFPFDKIKIDRSFIRDVSAGGDSVAIVRAVAAMGTSLGMATTAEGVETLEQLDCVRKEGCTEAQGYLFSAPRPAKEIERFLIAGGTKLKAIA